MLNILYIILPVVLWPLTGVILAKYGRKLGSYTTAFYRQVTIGIIGLPFLMQLLQKDAILFSQKRYILGASISGCIYLITNFLSSNLLPFNVMRIFYDSSRMIFGLFVGYFFLSEKVNIYDIVGIIFLFVGFYLFSLTKVDITHLKTKNIPLGILLSIINGGLFVTSSYFFKLYAASFSPLEAAVILETVNGVFIGIYLFFFLMLTHKNAFKISKRDFLLFFLLAPLSLLATFGLAKAYENVSFYVVNLLFVLQFIFSVFFSFLFLKEKLSYSQIFPTIVIVFALILIVAF